MYKTLLLTSAVIIALITSSLSFAGTKFINKDTAKDRQDNVFGTENEENEISMESDKDSNTIRVRPKKDKDGENDEETPVGPIFVVPKVRY